MYLMLLLLPLNSGFNYLLIYNLVSWVEAGQDSRDLYGLLGLARNFYILVLLKQEKLKNYI